MYIIRCRRSGQNKRVLCCIVVWSVLRVIDGENVTTSDEHMWLAPFTAGEAHRLTVTLRHATAVMALRFWNYNKSAEDTYRGVGRHNSTQT